MNECSELIYNALAKKLCYDNGEKARLFFISVFLSSEENRRDVICSRGMNVYSLRYPYNLRKGLHRDQHFGRLCEQQYVFK